MLPKEVVASWLPLFIHQDVVEEDRELLRVMESIRLLLDGVVVLCCCSSTKLLVQMSNAMTEK